MPKKAEMQIMSLWCMEMSIKMCQECHLAKTATPDTPEKNLIIFYSNTIFTVANPAATLLTMVPSAFTGPQMVAGEPHAESKM